MAVYNPWLGVRFSTCVHLPDPAPSRQSQRGRADWLVQAQTLDAVPDSHVHTDDSPGDWFGSLTKYLRDDHPLLSQREKAILLRRFRLQESAKAQTLEQVGHDLGLSKERVRQVQATALDKLRRRRGDPATAELCVL